MAAGTLPCGTLARMTSSSPAAASKATRQLRLHFVLSLMAIAAALALLWLFTPLRDVTSAEDMARLAQRLEAMPLAPLVVLAIYVLGGLILLPVSLTIAATGLVFGAWPGLAYALIGTGASALATYGVGAAIGQERLVRLGGAKIEALSKKAARKGLRSVIAIRLVPIAPFAVINAILGASHVSLRDYFVGTLIGMTPGIILKVVFADQLAEAAAGSDEGSLMTLAAAAVALIVIAVLARRYFRTREST